MTSTQLSLVVLSIGQLFLALGIIFICLTLERIKEALREMLILLHLSDLIDEMEKEDGKKPEN
jgi:hypothetical protein